MDPNAFYSYEEDANWPGSTYAYPPEPPFTLPAPNAPTATSAPEPPAALASPPCKIPTLTEARRSKLLTDLLDCRRGIRAIATDNEITTIELCRLITQQGITIDLAEFRHATLLRQEIACAEGTGAAVTALRDIFGLTLSRIFNFEAVSECEARALETSRKAAEALLHAVGPIRRPRDNDPATPPDGTPASSRPRRRPRPATRVDVRICPPPQLPAQLPQSIPPIRSIKSIPSHRLSNPAANLLALAGTATSCRAVAPPAPSPPTGPPTGSPATPTSDPPPRPHSEPHAANARGPPPENSAGSRRSITPTLIPRGPPSSAR